LLKSSIAVLSSVVIFHHSRPQCLTSSSEKDPSLILFPSSLFVYIHPVGVATPQPASSTSCR
jgi:hypothetical protein